MTPKKVASKGGQYLLETFYEGSLGKALLSNFPEHEWDPWRFVKPGFDWWAEATFARAFLNQLGNQLNIQELEDWYFVQLGRDGDLPIEIRRQGFDLQVAVEIAYPSHSWHSWRFGSKRLSWSPSVGTVSRRPPRAARDSPKSKPPTEMNKSRETTELKSLFFEVLETP